MDHDDIEQEVKRENDRKWQVSESAAKRKHELGMAKAMNVGLDTGDLAIWMVITLAATWITAGSTCHSIGKSSARETDADVGDMSSELKKCRRRFDALATRAGKGED